MRRAGIGRLALVVGVALLVLGAVAFVLAVRQTVSPADDLRPGAFVSALFFVAMGLYLVASGRNWLKEDDGADAPVNVPAAASARSRPVPVPPEEAELVEGPVSACLRCGSVDMRPLTLEGGLAFGSETLAWVCARCHWRGQPLHFDSATSYRAFVKGLHEEEREKEDASRA